jgi:DNA-binding NarL/FixJ family response regulator
MMAAASGERPVRVLIADDQRVVRDGLSLLLSLLPGVEVVGAAADGEDAVRQALDLVPDIVLMDLHMPVTDGVEATHRLTQMRPEIRVVVLTSFSDDDSVRSALRAGARGFLTKDAGADDIARAISLVRSGQAQLDPSIQSRLVSAIAHGGRLGLADGGGNGAGGNAGADPGMAAGGRLPDGLTAREAEVLAEIAAGLSNAQIAAKFVISGTTVKTHINHLLAKTGSRDRAQLVTYAFRAGLAR